MKKLNIASCSALVALCVFGLPALAGSNEMTLCDINEDVYFSCPLLGGKLVSVCAFGNDKPSSGYVQYRYGMPNKLEMSYPANKLAPAGRFVIVNASEGSVNKDIIKFKNSGYVYIVSQSIISTLSVLKGEKVVFRKSCDEGENAFVSRKARGGIESIPKSAENFR